MNETIEFSNIPSLSVEKVLSTLSALYINAIRNSTQFSSLPAVMLWSAPGVGKSTLSRTLAKIVQRETGMKTTFTDIRLLLFNPIDLRGIPTSDAEKQFAVWLKPKIFDLPERDDTVNFVLLDEISAAPPSVQASAYQLVLDRAVGEHKLASNTIVIAAGNRTTDRSVAYKMPKALANRFMHFNVESNFDSWKKWAIENKINDKVIGFISFRRDLLFSFDAESEDVAFPTPRAWEMVSNVICNVPNDADLIFTLVGGIVGTGIATEFKSWLTIYDSLPDIEDIFNGYNPPLPKSLSALYALVSAMTSYAREHKNEVKKIENSIIYANKMPPDFSTVLIKDYMSIENGYKEKLMKLPEFAKWLRTKGKLLNGI